MNAGYSGTPLAKKLGIVAGSHVFVHGAPMPYEQLLAPLPPGVILGRKPGREVNVVHLFTTRSSELESLLQFWRAAMASEAAIWVSWPKRASKVASDITEDTIRELALPLGLVDIKVCAVDEVWSGLKLVIRKQARVKAAGRAKSANGRMA